MLKTTVKGSNKIKLKKTYKNFINNIILKTKELLRENKNSLTFTEAEIFFELFEKEINKTKKEFLGENKNS